MFTSQNHDTDVVDVQNRSSSFTITDLNLQQLTATSLV